jgi:hypothetical protein
LIKLTLIIFFLLTGIAFADTCKTCHAASIDWNPNKEVIITAEKYLYVREKTNNNDAPEINKWLNNCGLGKGYSYCVAFVSSMYKETYENHNKKSPWPMTAGVASFAQYCSKRPFEFKMVSTKKLQWNIDSVNAGDVISFKHGSSIFTGFNYVGHKAIGIENIKQDIYTIEANTKSGPGGDQSGSVKGDMTYGHEGVYKRIRQISLNSKFPIMFIIKPIKKDIE